jgi:hypothetical protein
MPPHHAHMTNERTASRTSSYEVQRAVVHPLSTFPSSTDREVAMSAKTPKYAHPWSHTSLQDVTQENRGPPTSTPRVRDMRDARPPLHHAWLTSRVASASSKTRPHITYTRRTSQRRPGRLVASPPCAKTISTTITTTSHSEQPPGWQSSPSSDVAQLK